MSTINRTTVSDLRGAARLAFDATLGITTLVEKMHHTIQLVHPPLGASRAESTRGLTGLIYRSIRGTTRVIGKGLDAGLIPVAALCPKARPPRHATRRCPRSMASTGITSSALQIRWRSRCACCTRATSSIPHVPAMSCRTRPARYCWQFSACASTNSTGCAKTITASQTRRRLTRQRSSNCVQQRPLHRHQRTEPRDDAGGVLERWPSL